MAQQYEVELQGEDAGEVERTALLNWLRAERLPGVEAGLPAATPREGQMGIDLASAIQVVTADLPQLAAVLSAIGTWLGARRPRARVRVKRGDSEIFIDASNLPEMQATIDRALDIFAKSSS